MAFPQEYPKVKMTEDDYLAFERQSETRHEYVAGEVIAMTGAKWHHNVISANLSGLLGNALLDGPCVVVMGDMKLRVEGIVSYRYPDVIVVCDAPVFFDDREDVVTNPTVVVEVLSPSTELIDRNKKLREYRQLPSLQAYLLVAQREARIERFLRQRDDDWLYTDVVGLDAAIDLPSLGCTLALSEVYNKVQFEDADDEA